jgi:ATPase subunit of ABC transporter with duplicated ATPase domains
MTHPQILIHEMSFNLPTGKALFNKLNLVFSKHKTGLVGKNGVGKSTLMKLVLGELYPNSGYIHLDGTIAYAPQHPPISSKITVASFLGCEEKINALYRITQGSADERDFNILNEDWEIKDRMQKQLTKFGLNTISFNQPLIELSGGEVTRLMLTKVFFSDADFLLLDEPTNHLDATARQQLYHAIQQWQRGLLVISHDRELLNFMDEIVELTTLGAYRFGGNYDAYQQEKNILTAAKEQQLADAQKLLNKTKRSIQSTKEKHEQRQAQGRELRRSGSQPKIMLDAMENRSTQSQGSLLTRHNHMLNNAENKLLSAKEHLEITNAIDIELPETKVPNGKMILEIENLTFSYPHTTESIINQFDLQLQGPARIALGGANGSGKTTLIKLILGKLQPSQGKINIGTNYIRYLDQDASLLDTELSILENFMRLNPDANQNDAYRCLAQFLFKNTAALKFIRDLSGGEKLRASLACALLAKHPPQLLILDEPTNHLDIHSIQSIESALKHYQGAMIVISHDTTFLKNIEIERIIYAPFK